MSTEYSRSEVSQQYFELRNELNRTNKTKNINTELQFIIREHEDECFIIIKSTGAEHGLRLAYKRKTITGRWILFENELYGEFYKYMFVKIGRLNPDDELNINYILTSWLLRLWVV